MIHEWEDKPNAKAIRVVRARELMSKLGDRQVEVCSYNQCEGVSHCRGYCKADDLRKSRGRSNEMCSNTVGFDCEVSVTEKG